MSSLCNRAEGASVTWPARATRDVTAGRPPRLSSVSPLPLAPRELPPPMTEESPMHRSSILAILAAAALAAACSDDAQPTALAGLPDQSAGAATDTGTARAAFPGAVWGYGAAGADSADGLGRVAGATVR